MPSNTQSGKESCSVKTYVRNAEIADRSRTDEQKSKPTIPIIINRCKSCGSAKDATTYGTKATKRFPKIDLLTAGVPCQPASAAGKRAGTNDDRWLWPETFRIIRETRPRWCILENVGGLLTLERGVVFDSLLSTLEAAGYEVWAFVIPACAVNAPHRRDRVWIIANANSNADRGRTRKNASEGDCKGLSERHEMAKSSEPSAIRNAANAESEQAHAAKQGGLHAESRRTAGDVADNAELGAGRNEKGSRQRGQRNRDERDQGTSWREDWPAVAARLCSLDDGLPNGLARPKRWRNAALKGAGNAIVPQVAEEIMRAIKSIN